MDRERFIASHRDRWHRLEVLASRVERDGAGALTAGELLELGRLYRSATSDLAVARRDYPTDRVAAYLNGLVARVHPVVYRGERPGLDQVGRFVRYGFPEAYRAIGRYTLFAFALFAAAAIVSYLLVALNDRIADVLLPGTAQSLRRVMDRHQLWMNQPGESSSIVANYIMLNNIQVAVIAFAGGILAGVLTAYVMLSNGVMLGAIGAMVDSRGLGGGFWSFVVPHGVIELSVIFMAGGAGLAIGDALLRPGLRSRGSALAGAARTSGFVLLGGAPLLVIAGTIEGFLSPSAAPVAIKLAVGTVTGVLLYLYLLRSRPKTVSATYRFDELLDRSPLAHTDARALSSR